MRVKTFRGTSTAAVFAEIKAEFGDDAVILSNKTAEENGRRIHEIMVGIENHEEPVQKRSTREEVIDDAMNNLPDWCQEWNQIKGHMMALLKPQMNLNLLAPRQRLALEYLEREGVESKVILDLFQQLRGDKARPILPELEKIVPVRPLHSSEWKEKFHALAGPHGVGKTSTIIRLALKEKERILQPASALLQPTRGRAKDVWSCVIMLTFQDWISENWQPERILRNLSVKAGILTEYSSTSLDWAGMPNWKAGWPHAAWAVPVTWQYILY